MSAVAQHLAGQLQIDLDQPASSGSVRPFPARGRLRFESWARVGGPGIAAVGEAADTPTHADVRAYLRDKPWVTPSQAICFLTDLHADRDAFWRSLVDTGMVDLGMVDTDGLDPATPDASTNGVESIADPIASTPDEAFRPTAIGARTHFLIGGDLFDKGPANLPLLDALARFRRTGVRFTLLAGNHDVRTYLGIRHARATDPRLAHLFVRMGKKTMTLLKEVFDAHLAGGAARGRRRDDEVRETLFPSERWFEEFPRFAAELVPPGRIDKELRRVREKIAEIEERCASLGLSLGDVDAALDRCRALFLDPDGEYFWVFEEMQIAYREGSVLFAHAGVDDVAAGWIATRGLNDLRSAFKMSLCEEPFELYNGSLGNMFRTKYRDIDLPLTPAGVASLHRAGIYAIVHGHRNVYLGQNMNFRRGVLNFACDACVDRNTRRVEDLSGPGSATTLLSEDGTIYGLSADHPAIKVFDPAHYAGWVMQV